MKKIGSSQLPIISDEDSDGTPPSSLLRPAKTAREARSRKSQPAADAGPSSKRLAGLSSICGQKTSTAKWKGKDRLMDDDEDAVMSDSSDLACKKPGERSERQTQSQPRIARPMR
ncbi:hypothetical protein BDZ90DRAFT_177968 [Jaminaea rosea]|uniref:Uncharacterized protein n=1 Tax=Jaminaea rosea TaxID=1569628 RepID=A0A316UR18_9BASI|nr:hypothetical protein BDZ90DRAFT_177968 [Jaminaea rosea]PWN27424.1 hypothetical protein BDZ90DRAFT_177968 [Jaminaea rosea]